MTDDDILDLYELKHNFEKQGIFDQITLQNWYNRFRLLYLTIPEIQQKLEPIHSDLLNMYRMVESVLMLHKINQEANTAIQSFPNDRDPTNLESWIKTYKPLFDQVYDISLDILEYHVIDKANNTIQFSIETGHHSNPPQEFPPETDDWGDWIVTQRFTLKCELAPVEASINFADLYFQKYLNEVDDEITDFDKLN